MELNISSHLKSLGCESSVNIALAYQVYIELFEVKSMYDVDFGYDKDLDIVYLTAKPSKNSSTHIFIPHMTSQPLSLKSVTEFQNKLCQIEQKTVTIACVEGDSTVVLYSLASGLVDVEDPKYLVRHKTREERRNFLENEVRKKHLSILVEAFKQV